MSFSIGGVSFSIGGGFLHRGVLILRCSVGCCDAKQDVVFERRAKLYVVHKCALAEKAVFFGRGVKKACASYKTPLKTPYGGALGVACNQPIKEPEK